MSNKSTAQSVKSSKLGVLPRWDLSDLYGGIDSKQINSDLGQIAIKVEYMVDTYKGKLEKSGDGKFLATSIKEYEVVSELLAKIASFAFLQYSTAVNNPQAVAFFQNIQEKLTDLTTPLLFFTLEINRISDDLLTTMLQDKELARYKPWLRDIRAFRPYQLSDAEEVILHEKSLTSTIAWNRLFDETLAALRFPFRGEELGCSAVMEKMASPNEEIRRDAATSISTVLQDNTRLLSMITNTLAKDKAVIEARRGFKKPMSSRNLANFIEDDVVEVLLTTVRKNYPNLSHRYYKLKCKMLGKKVLQYWDRNAPFTEIDESIPWNKAVSTVLAAYGQFHPRMEELGRQFFDNNWVDAPLEPSKRTGAFAHPTIPSKHPYLLVNYAGRTRDVMTLAHELGHGVHMVLANTQGPLMSDTPLTLAETASVFGEQLTFRYLLANEQDKEKRKIMIANKVEDMLNTVIRQVAFCDFELKVHSERANGELSSERIGEIWMETARESLGEGIHLDESYSCYWSYIPHFIHSPFYVYSYAFGDCLVNSLYQVYLSGKVANFEECYFQMLSAGGTLRHKELLAPFGLDASDPEFWQKGLDVISEFIDELERMV
ncbi:MAG: M3 family oligoendopeptidase [Proteobacteria bacterium]|nr:M3 family oligoendopeptidase [Pseudomonadota bacterium]